MGEGELTVLILLVGAAWAFACWVAYDCGYDRGWWDGNRRGR